MARVRLTGSKMTRDETRSVERGAARKPLAKAIEFCEGSRVDLDSGRPNSAALAAIHAGISASDAALIAVAGVRSVARDHGAVIPCWSHESITSDPHNGVS